MKVLVGIVLGSVLFFLLGCFLTGGPSPRIDRFGFYGAVLVYWVLAGAAGALAGSLAGAYEVVVGVLVAFGGSFLLEVFLGYLGGGVFDAGRFLLAALFALPACAAGAALAKFLSSRTSDGALGTRPATPAFHQEAKIREGTGTPSVTGQRTVPKPPPRHGIGPVPKLRVSVHKIDNETRSENNVPKPPPGEGRLQYPPFSFPVVGDARLYRAGIVAQG